MATIDDARLVKMLLNNNGHFDDDPQAFTIWSYKNLEGKRTQAVFYTDWQDMYESQYVSQPELLWSRQTGLTRAGKLWLQENKEK